MRLALIPLTDERLDRLDAFVRAVKVAIAEDPTKQDAEPKLDLIEPGSVRRRVVEAEPTAMTPIPRGDKVSLGCIVVRVQIIEDDMDLALSIGGGNLVPRP